MTWSADEATQKLAGVAGGQHRTDRGLHKDEQYVVQVVDVLRGLPRKKVIDWQVVSSVDDAKAITEIWPR